MVRTKVIAVLLGPGGIGLEAIFDSVVTFARTLFELGIGSSGVRQIAAAVGVGDEERISRTVFTLRRICIFLGVVGTPSLFLARDFVSRLAFGSGEQATNIGILSVILLLGTVAAGQSALLQGMRRIGDLAKANILGTLLGAIVSIPIVLAWGRDGIPYYMVAAAGTSLLVSWIYARRIRIQTVAATAAEVFRETSSLLRLGLAFLSSALMSTGALFLLRVMVAREYSAEGAGQFQAASALSMVYVGFILQAMGTDFYPRLTAVASDNVRCNQLVNEQAEISLLLALPGVLGTLAFAPWVVKVFYSGQFDIAAQILCWQMAGNFLRIVSWPMGFILLAKGKGALFVLTDALAWAMYVTLAWVGLRWFGLPGIGMAFFGLYLFHVLLIALVVGWCSGFLWSAMNQRLLLLGVISVGLTLSARLLLPEPWATLIGTVFVLTTGILFVRALAAILGKERIGRICQKLHIPSSVLKFRGSTQQTVEL